MKIKVRYAPREYIGVFGRLPSGVTYLREWVPSWYKKAMNWSKSKTL